MADNNQNQNGVFGGLGFGGERNKSSAKHL